MSVVVVVRKSGKAVIAADTLYSFGTTKVAKQYLRQLDKIQKVKDSYIGVVGAIAHDNVLDHLFKKEARGLSFDSREEIFNSYLKLHPILKEKYFLNAAPVEEDEYEPSQIDGLIANSNGIFGIFSLREVYEFESFWAVGSGADYAIGAMFSTYDMLATAEEIAETGVRAACEFDNGCGLPMTTYSINLKA